MTPDVAISAVARGVMRTRLLQKEPLSFEKILEEIIEHVVTSGKATSDAAKQRYMTVEDSRAAREATDDAFYCVLMLALAAMNALAEFPHLDEIDFSPEDERLQ